MPDSPSETNNELVSVRVAAEQTGYNPATIVTLAMTHQIGGRKERIPAPNKLGLRSRVNWQISLPSLKAYIARRKEAGTVVKRQALGVVWLVCPACGQEMRLFPRNLELLQPDLSAHGGRSTGRPNYDRNRSGRMKSHF